MMKHLILVVDDDDLMRLSVGTLLERAGYEVQVAASGQDALACVRRRYPDLVLLDVGLPDMDGLQILPQIRDIAKVPVIFLTARRRKLDELLGLELGAEDYITKPFDTDMLLMRVRVALRRGQPTGLTVGDLTIDPGTYTVAVGEKRVALPPREFALLYALAAQAGQVVTVEELLQRAWGAGFEGEPQVLYVRVRMLRALLEEEPNRPRRIVTVRGVGYMLVPQEP